MYRNFFIAQAAFLAAATSAEAQQSTQPQQFYSPNSSGSIETVVVTASPLAKNPDDLAISASKVERGDILKSGGGNLADALEEIPGVRGSSFAAGASRPIIRGFDANRVRLLEDGIGSFDVSDIGPDHGVPVDPLSAKSIEVVRGAATLRFGSQAIGGVVNALNNRVPETLSDEPFTGEITGIYGSASNLGQTSAMMDARAGSFAIHADGFYRNAGNYDTPLGIQGNSFFRGDGFSLGSSYFFGDDNRIGGAVIQYDAKYGIPGEDAFILMRQTKGLSRSSFNIGYGPLQTLNLDFGYANYSHEEKNQDGSVNATFKNKEFDGRMEQLIGAIGPFSSSAFGIQAQNREYQALGEAGSYLFPTVTTSIAGFFFTELPLSDALHVQASGRIETVHVTGTPASDVSTERDFTPLSGAAGLLYDVNDWLKVGLSASSAARAPAQTELFSRGPHDGPRTFESGDPTLKTERANSLEGTLRIRDGKFTFDGSLWSSWFDNYIYGKLTGRTCEEDGSCTPGDANELKELNYAQQGARFWGLEGKGAYQLWKPGEGMLSLEVQGDYVRATFDDGSNVPRIPPYRIGGGFSWTSANVDAGILFLYIGRQNDFGLFDTPTPSYVELNANIAWRPLDSNPGLELLLVGHNLADTQQRNAASFNKGDILQPGRDIRIVLRQAF